MPFPQQQTQEIVFPKQWKTLTQQEQLEWIKTYFMPKTRIPEPYPKIDSIAKGQKIRTQKGFIIKIPKESKLIQKNPDIVREFETWLDNWLITVFHDKKCPATKFIGISNPHSEKWIAQELSIENWRKFFGILSRIGNKYGLIRPTKPKSTRKKHDFPLSLKHNTRGVQDG
jgi:hypothetical protein